MPWGALRARLSVNIPLVPQAAPQKRRGHPQFLHSCPHHGLLAVDNQQLRSDQPFSSSSVRTARA